MKTQLKPTSAVLAAIFGLVLFSGGACAQIGRGGPPPVFRFPDVPLTLQAVVGDSDLKANQNKAMSILVNVLDGHGDPVSGLQSRFFQLVTYNVPVNGNCGPAVNKLDEIQPGLYYIVGSMSAPFNCSWVAGDYLSDIVLNVGGMSGTKTPIKIHVAQ